MNVSYFFSKLRLTVLVIKLLLSQVKDEQFQYNENYTYSKRVKQLWNSEIHVVSEISCSGPFSLTTS